MRNKKIVKIFSSFQIALTIAISLGILGNPALVNASHITQGQVNTAMAAWNYYAPKSRAINWNSRPDMTSATYNASAETVSYRFSDGQRYDNFAIQDFGAITCSMGTGTGAALTPDDTSRVGDACIITDTIEAGAIRPTANLKINNSDGPVTVSPGATINLSWSSTQAASCSARATPLNGSWTGTVTINGTKSISNVSTQTTFSLDCYSTTQHSSQDSVLVKTSQVSPPPPPPPAARPLYYLGPYRLDPEGDTVVCGQEISFTVENYSKSQIWLVQTKTTAAKTENSIVGVLNIPDVFTLVCNRDVGLYENKVYEVINGSRGNLLGEASLQVLGKADEDNSPTPPPYSTPLGDGVLNIQNVTLGSLDVSSQTYALIEGYGFAGQIDVSISDPGIEIEDASVDSDLGSILLTLRVNRLPASNSLNFTVSSGSEADLQAVTWTSADADSPQIDQADVTVNDTSATILIRGSNFTTDSMVEIVGSNLRVDQIRVKSESEIEIIVLGPQAADFSKKRSAFISTAAAETATQDNALLLVSNSAGEATFPLTGSELFALELRDPKSSTTQAGTIPSTGFGQICSKEKGLAACIKQLYLFGLGLGAFVALLMVVVAGYRYMTAAGNAQQTEKAKETFATAFIGLIIIFVAFVLLYLINPDLVQFKPLKPIVTPRW